MVTPRREYLRFAWLKEMTGVGLYADHTVGNFSYEERDGSRLVFGGAFYRTKLLANKNCTRTVVPLHSPFLTTINELPLSAQGEIM